MNKQQIENLSNLKRILLIEDDAKLGKKIRHFLHQYEFEVDWLTGGSLVGVETTIKTYDLILCDINLPDISGFDICKTWRKHFTGKFIFMTAMSDDASQLNGFDLGADDYIIKPVQPQLLLARIRANLTTHSANNMNNESDNIISLPHLRIDVERHEVSVNDELLVLTPQELQLLYILARNFETKVSREAIFQLVMCKEYDGFDRTVDVYISKLRKKFNLLEKNPYEIRTLWGKGYILTSEKNTK